MSARKFLSGLKAKYEEHHKCIYTPGALHAAATFSDRYIHGRFLPDKAIDLLDEAGAKMRIEMIKLTLKNKFGSKNVNYNATTDFFEVHVTKQAIAISTDGISQWKFLVFEENQRAILEQLVPKELIKRLK